MDIRRLQAFCKVYELKSFSRAGEMMLLSQPTISAHIMSLENELDARLFDRLSRVVLPTAAAEILYRRAREVFENLESARAEILALKDRVAGDLIIGGSTIPAHYILPEIIASFRRRFKEVVIDLIVGDSKEIADQVAEGILSVGVVGAAVDHPDLVCEQLIKDEIILIAPPGLKIPVSITGGGTFDAGALCGLPWIIREQGSGTRQAFERALRDVGLDARDLSVSVMAHSTLGVLQCVKAGLGVSVTSKLAAMDMLARGELSRFDVPGLAIKRNFYCVSHGKRYVYPALAHFKKALMG
jgi:LysR family transcriptional regulator, transcriptional activator of the cysJI operon